MGVGKQGNVKVARKGRGNGGIARDDRLDRLVLFLRISRGMGTEELHRSDLVLAMDFAVHQAVQTRRGEGWRE